MLVLKPITMFICSMQQRVGLISDSFRARRAIKAIKAIKALPDRRDLPALRDGHQARKGAPSLQHGPFFLGSIGLGMVPMRAGGQVSQRSAVMTSVSKVIC